MVLPALTQLKKANVYRNTIIWMMARRLSNKGNAWFTYNTECEDGILAP